MERSIILTIKQSNEGSNESIMLQQAISYWNVSLVVQLLRLH